MNTKAQEQEQATDAAAQQPPTDAATQQQPAPDAAPQQPPGKAPEWQQEVNCMSCSGGGAGRILRQMQAKQAAARVAARHLVIVGATSAIAEHCARNWAARGPKRITLIARNAERLERVAGDLRVRAPGATVETLVLPDFCDAAAIDAAIDRLWNIAPVDWALIAHGMLAEQKDCERDLTLCRDMLMVNGVSPALFAEAIGSRMQQVGGGKLAVIGSVAGDRGRKANYAYGAGKGMVERYVQGLQHRIAYAGSDVRVTLIKPGPTDTPMTAKQKAAGARLASVESVAQAIVEGIDAGKATIYAPWHWALIMGVIRHIPAAIFHKLNI